MTEVHDARQRAKQTRFTSDVTASPTTLLILGRIGGQRFAWPAAAVERVLPMASVTRVPGLPDTVLGLLDLHGDTLAVVDPRARLGMPSVAAQPEQHLILLNAPRRYLVWVDRVDSVVALDPTGFETLNSDQPLAYAMSVVRIDGELVSLLSPSAFDPGSVTSSAVGAA